MDPYVKLGQAIKEAESVGFSPSETGALGPEEQSDRIGVARNRLYCLGYLWKDKQRKSKDHRFQKALRAFQTDANLTVSGQLNDKTWVALDQLVGFESSIEIDEWFENGIPFTALGRAVHLRLATFGLLDRLGNPSIESYKQANQARTFDGGLRKFATLARLLQFGSGLVEPTINEDTLRVLFDQDRLIERLAAMGRGMTVAHRDNASSDEIRVDNKMVVNFVRHVARIELWLAGFGTKPRRQYCHEYGGTALTLNRAMPKFWAQQPKSERPRRSERLDISGQFFTQLQSLVIPDAGIATEQQIGPIIEQVLSDKPTAKQVKSAMKSLGSRIWDGIKRAWRWLMRTVATAWKSLANGITNVARIIKSAAAGMYEKVRSAIYAFTASVGFILSTRFKPIESDQLLMVRERDFDFDLFIDSDAPMLLVRAFFTEYGRRSRLLAISARIVTRLAGLVIRVVVRTGMGGWFGLAIALTQLGKAIKGISRLAKEAGEILLRIDPPMIEAT